MLSSVKASPYVGVDQASHTFPSWDSQEHRLKYSDTGESQTTQAKRWDRRALKVHLQFSEIPLDLRDRK